VTEADARKACGHGSAKDVSNWNDQSFVSIARSLQGDSSCN